MDIKVKLFATFREGRGKELSLQINEGTAVQEILATLGINRSEVAIMLINGRDGSFDAPLSEGDAVSLFPPLGGG